MEETKSERAFFDPAVCRDCQPTCPIIAKKNVFVPPPLFWQRLPKAAGGPRGTSVHAAARRVRRPKLFLVSPQALEPARLPV